MEENVYEVTWRKGNRGYFKTEIEGPEKPLEGEAAQVVAVKEDEDVTKVSVEKIEEVTDE